MSNLIHLALADNGLVVAAFIKTADAAEFCSKNGLCHMPFNPANSAGTPCPAVGNVYVA